MTEQNPEQMPQGPQVPQVPDNPALPDAFVPKSTTNVIDLDAQRKQRAAAREGHKEDLPIILGGRTIATLPVELPIDVFAPLRDLDGDVTLILRSAMTAIRTQGNDASKWDAGELIIDVLAANPSLPVSIIDAITKVATNLLSQTGFDALMAERPSTEDLAFFAQGVLRFYGLSLGESSAPSGSPEGSGATSNTTSSTTSGSTPDASTPTPVAPSSSESAVS